MRVLIIFLSLVGLITPVRAEQPERYVSDEKVVFETPEEEDVLKVNLSFGFLTVLEFAEKPLMVAVGDDALIQIEVPDNSRNVVVKPLEPSGTTNLFVFTPSKRFNYQVTIGSENASDYVVDTSDQDEAFYLPQDRGEISLVDLIKMTKNYPVLKELGNINEKKLKYKKMFQVCSHPKVSVVVLGVFQYKHPEYLIVHFRVSNSNYKEMTLTENNTNLFADEEKFVPQYVFFDQTNLQPNEKTEGWLFIKDSHLSLENNFRIAIGAGDETYKCR